MAEYRFDDGSGQVLTDYSGNAKHGELGTTSGSDTNDPANKIENGGPSRIRTGDYRDVNAVS